MPVAVDDTPATPEDGPGDYGLVMPFLSVASQGGPHEDIAYVAGWEMGALDAELSLSHPPTLDRAIRCANARQADLIAMKHGYRAEIEPYDDQWCLLHLAPCQELLP